MANLVFETLVNTPVKVPFVSTNNTTGLTSFANVILLKDGVSTPLSTTFTELGSGLYVATFTPTTTGTYTYFIEQRIQATIRVVSKSIYTFLQNLEDEAIGSWVWDKNAGTLVIKRQSGADMAGFTVVDNLTTASRERTTP